MNPRAAFEIREITGSQVEKVFPIMKELRTNLDEESYLRLYKEAKLRDEYKLVGAIRDELCYGLMGYRILYDFVHGKHVYIDDLVVTKDVRGQGLGAQLLAHAQQIAEKENCQGLRLCTGVDNHDAKRFYERHGWAGKAIAYKIRL